MIEIKFVYWFNIWYLIMNFVVTQFWSTVCLACGVSLSGVMVYMLDWNIVVSKFELGWADMFPFGLIPMVKVLNTLIPLAMG